MNDNTRHHAATTTAGLVLVGAGGAARSEALNRAYGKDAKGKPMPRPTGFPKKFFHERKLLHTRAGRGYYAAGTAAALLGGTAAISGVTGLTKTSKRDTPKRKSFVAEGVSGVNNSLRDRMDTAKNPAPVRLVAGNYGAGAGVGAAAAGFTHHKLKNVRVHGNAKSAAAATAGVLAGAATLPLQSKLTQRFSHGKYETTPTGVRRRKKVMAKSYYGQDMSPGKKRAITMTAGSTPFIGDFTAAAAAARLAPPELRHKTAAWQFGGSQSGNIVGGAVGAYGAVAAAKHPTVQRRATKASDAIDSAANKVRAKVGLKPAGKPILLRAAENEKTPKLVRGALKPLARNPKVAALGLLAGTAVGTHAGGWTGYGHALKLEKERNIKSRDNRHGVSKRAGAPANVMTPADNHRQANKKRLQANISVFTGATGMGALGAGLASKIPKLRAGKWGAKLAHAQTPLLTAGAGVGGIGSFNFARYTRAEANAQDQKKVKKALAGVLPKHVSFNPKMPTKSQRVVWGTSATAAAGGPAVVHAQRKQANKKKATVAGGATGLAGAKLGLDLGQYSMREAARHKERRVDAKAVDFPISRSQRDKIRNAHRHAHGFHEGKVPGARGTFYTQYPKTLPAWKLRRTVARLDNPVAALSILAAGAVAGAKVGSRDVHKAFALSRISRAPGALARRPGIRTGGLVRTRTMSGATVTSTRRGGLVR